MLGIIYSGRVSRLLKLVTGVDISTRPVRVAGRAGKAENSSKRTAAAAANTATVLLPTLKALITTQ